MTKKFALRISLIICAVIPMGFAGNMLRSAPEVNGPGIPAANPHQPGGKPLAVLDRGSRIVVWHRGYLYLPGEKYASAYDISNPRNPRRVDDKLLRAENTHRNTHGHYKIGDVFAYVRQYITPEVDQSKTHYLDISDPTNRRDFMDQSSVPFPLKKDAMFFPYEFLEFQGIKDIRTGQLIGRYNFRTETGVTKFDWNLIGNILFIQPQKGSVAAVDIGDPTKPKLLSILEGNFGQYTTTSQAIWKNHLVLVGGPDAQDKSAQGNVVLIDISDPSNLRLKARYNIPGRYMEFQDEFGFTRSKKVNMNTGEVVQTFDPPRREAADFQWTPVGHLLIDSGSSSGQAGDTNIFVHQAGPDTRRPEVSFHLPKDGATRLPVTSHIGVVISDTLDDTTVNAGNIVLRTQDGNEILNTLISITSYNLIRISPLDGLKPDTTYVVEMRNGIRDAVGNRLIPKTFRFSTGAKLDDGPPPVLDVDCAPITLKVGEPVSFTADLRNASGDVRYQWIYGDGQNTGLNESNAQREHSYSTAGIYTARARAVFGEDTLIKTCRITVEAIAQGPAPTRSGTVALDAQRRRVWTVNPDNNSVTVLDADDNSMLFRTDTCKNPGGVAVDKWGRGWVTCQDDDQIFVIRGGDGVRVRSIALDYGTGPLRIVFNPAGTLAYVSTNSGELLELGFKEYTVKRRLKLTPQNLGGADFEFHQFTQSDNIQSVEQLSAKTLKATGIKSDGVVNLDVGLNRDSDDKFFGLVYRGTLNVPLAGQYKFHLRSDDGAKIIIDRRTLVNNDAGNWDLNTWKAGKIWLSKGNHKITVKFIQKGGSRQLNILYDQPEMNRKSLRFNHLKPLLTRTAKVRDMAVSGDGKTLYAARLISEDGGGSVYRINLDGFSLAQNIRLPIDALTDDGETRGRGVPSYLGSIALSPDNGRAWIPAVKMNILRGEKRDGQLPDFQTSVRAMLRSFPLNGVSTQSSWDFDNRSQPSAVTFSSGGNHIFVAFQGNNKVGVYDAGSGQELAVTETMLAPDGLAFDADTGKLFVKNFMSRTMTIFDARDVLENKGVEMQQVGVIRTTPQKDALTRAQLFGKRIFYNAGDTRMSRDGYLSCAACHLNGGSDGRVWDFTHRGEGFRKTTSLLGRKGTAHGNVHWTGNFDEIQDFEQDMRFHFGGSGFMSNEDFNEGTRNTGLGDTKAGISRELDDLAAYLSSLNKFPRSPNRTVEGSLTAQATAGRTIFKSQNCASCHGGSDFIDGKRHDVGTIKDTSGRRMGGDLDGIDTPTLVGIWATPPYLHDGSAATLQDVFYQGKVDGPHGRVRKLARNKQINLFAYLNQLDGSPGEALSEETFLESLIRIVSQALSF